MPYGLGQYKLFDNKGTSFYENVQNQLKGMGFEAHFETFIESYVDAQNNPAERQTEDFARFSIRPAGQKKGNWLDLNIGPGPETELGQSLLVHSTDEGAALFGAEIFQPEKGDPYGLAPIQAFGGYLGATFKDPRYRGSNNTELFWESIQRANPAFKTAGGISFVSPFHNTEAIEDFAKRIGVSASPDFVQGITGALDNIRRLKENATAVGSKNFWGRLNKYVPVAAEEGGPTTLQQLLFEGSKGLMATRSDPSKSLKSSTVVSPTNLRGRRDQALPLTWTDKGIEVAPSHQIEGLQTNASYRELNAIYAGESAARKSIVIPGMFHVPATPAGGAGMTYNSPLENIFGFGMETKIRQKLSYENLGQVAATDFQFGIFEQQNMKNIDLKGLMGYGLSEGKAQAILDYRARGGRLTSPTDITSIPGVGKVSAKKLSPLLEGEGQWIKTRDLEGAVAPVGKTVTWGLIQHEGKTIPLQHTQQGSEAYFAGQPYMTVPRFVTGAGRAVSGQEKGRYDLYTASRGKERGYGKELLDTIRKQFPGDVNTKGIHHLEVVAPILKQVNTKITESAKSTLNQAAAPQGEPYRPITKMSGMDIEATGVVSGVKSLPGIFAGMYAALPSNLQAQMAQDIGYDPAILGVGEGKADYAEMTRRYNIATGKNLNQAELMTGMFHSFVGAARERPEYFKSTYEMGVTAEGENIDISYGYVNDWERQAFQGAMNDALKLNEPNLSEEARKARVDELYKFEKDDATGLYEMRFSSPALYGPSVFTPSPEHMTKVPSYTGEEMAAVAKNFPNLLGQYFEEGDIPEHVSGWRSLGRMHQLKISPEGEQTPGQNIRTDISANQISEVQRIAREAGGSIQDYEAAVEQVLPGAKDILYSPTGQMIPHPRLGMQISEFSLGVDTEDKALQKWTRDYGKLFGEALNKGTPSSKSALGQFWNSLELAGSGKDSKLYQNTARTILNDLVGGRYAMQLGLPTTYGGDNILVQDPTLLAMGTMNQRMLKEVQKNAMPFAGLLARTPFLARTSGLKGVNVWSHGAAEAATGMRYIKAPGRTSEGDPIPGNPFASGLMGHTSPMAIWNMVGDFDLDPGILKILRAAKGDTNLLSELAMPQTFEQWKKKADVLARSSAWEKSGIPGAAFNETIKEAADINAINRNNEAQFINKLDPGQADTKVAWASGENTIVAGRGMGTAYNLRRWWQSAAEVKGFNPDLLAAGHDARMPNYQGYLDKALQGTQLEKMVTSATWREDAGRVSLTSALGTLWPDADVKGGREGLAKLENQIGGALRADEILHPIDRAAFLSSTPEEFSEMQKWIMDEGRDWESVYNEITSREGWDPRNTNVYAIMAASATRKLHGFAGARQSSSKGSDKGLNPVTQNLARFRKHPGSRIEMFPGSEPRHPGEFLEEPQVAHTITGYQAQDPRAGLPSASAAVAYMTLSENANANAPINTAIRTRFGGDLFREQWMMMQAARSSGKAKGEAYVDKVRKSAEQRGVNTGSVGGGQQGGGGDGNDTGTGYIPLGEEDDGSGGRRGFSMEDLNFTIRFAGNKDTLLGIQQMSKAAIFAGEYKGDAQKYADDLGKLLDDRGFSDGTLVNRVLRFQAQNPEAARGALTEHHTKFAQTPRGRATLRGAGYMATARNASASGITLPSEVEDLLADKSIDRNMSLINELDSTYNRAAARSGKKDFSRVDFDEFAKSFEKLDAAVKQSTERFTDMNEQIDKLPQSRQTTARDYAMKMQIGTSQRAEKAAAVQRAIDVGDPDELSRAYADYAQTENLIKGSELGLERELEGRGSRLGRGFRKAFGGFGLMYMRSMLNFGMGQFQKGYQEYDEFAQQANMGAISSAGVSAITPYESRQYAAQRAAIRSGGNVYAALQQWQGQTGMQDVMGSLGTGIGMAGIATHLASSFGVTGGAALGGIAGVAGAAGILGGFALTQYSYAQNPNDTLIQAVAQKQSGNDLAAAIKGYSLRKYGPWEAFEKMTTGEPSWREQEVALNYQTEALLEGKKFGFGGVTPQEALQISMAAANTENQPINVLPPQLSQQLEFQNALGNLGLNQEQIVGVGTALQAGLPIDQIASAGITIQNRGATPSQTDITEAMADLYELPTEILKKRAQGATLLSSMQNPVAFQEAITNYGYGYEMSNSRFQELMGNIEGGPNEMAFSSRSALFERALATGASLPALDIEAYDRNITYTSKEKYQMGVDDMLYAKGQQYYEAAQSLGANWETANQLKVWSQGGIEQSRFAGRLLNMDQYAIQQAAMAGGGGLFQELANMDINAQGQLTGLSWGTTSLARGNVSSSLMGMQILGGLAGSEAGQAAIAGGTRGLSWWKFEQDNAAQEAQMGIQAQRLALQEKYQPLFWNIEDRQTALSNRQQEYSFQYQQEQFDLSGRQFQENMAFQRQQQLRNRTWTQQDWGYQDTMRSMQWGWQQEDFQENVRFMTGRERRQAERQMERQTIVHGMETDRTETERQRQKQLWADEDQRYEMTIRHNKEVRDLQEENMKMQIEFYQERKKLQEESTALNRQYWEENMELNKASLGIQQEQLQKNKEYAEVVKLISEKQEDYAGQWALAQATAEETVAALIQGFSDLLENFPEVVKNMINGAPTTLDEMINGGSSQTTSQWNDNYVGMSTDTGTGINSVTIPIDLGGERLATYYLNLITQELKVAS